MKTVVILAMFRLLVALPHVVPNAEDRIGIITRMFRFYGLVWGCLFWWDEEEQRG
jgi:hypothetical protein